MVIQPDGIKYFALRDGAFDSKAFGECMRALVRRFRVLRRGEVTVVMDNARIHKTRRVTDFFHEKGVEHQLLLPQNLRPQPDRERLRDCQGEVSERGDSNDPGCDGGTTRQRP